VDAMMKFSELDRELVARIYDGMIRTFSAPNQIDLAAAYCFKTRKRTAKV